MQTESALAESNEDALQTDGSAENYLSQIIDQVDILLLKIALFKPKDKETITNFGVFFLLFRLQIPQLPQRRRPDLLGLNFLCQNPREDHFSLRQSGRLVKKVCRLLDFKVEFYYMTF